MPIGNIIATKRMEGHGGMPLARGGRFVSVDFVVIWLPIVVVCMVLWQSRPLVGRESGCDNTGTARRYWSRSCSVYCILILCVLLRFFFFLDPFRVTYATTGRILMMTLLLSERPIILFDSIESIESETSDVHHCHNSSNGFPPRSRLPPISDKEYSRSTALC